MTIYEIKDKYSEYWLDYVEKTNVLLINKKIRVKDYVSLKHDLKEANIKLKDIVVVGRR